MPLLSNLDWANWAYGLWVAVVGGGSNAVTAGLGLMVLDPTDFTLAKGKLWGMVGGLFVLSAVKDFFLYLSQSPAPKIIAKSSSTATLTGTGDGAVLHVESTKETSTPVQ